MNKDWIIVSKYRPQLMLLSILWVIAFHFSPPIHANMSSLKILFSIGCGGVDIFMFLSGFGLCYNYYEREEVTPIGFYKRRFTKILPTYYLCIVAFGLIRDISLPDILWQLSCIGFWLRMPSYDWYVPSIMALYLAFPLFVKLSKKYGIVKCVIFASLIGLLPTALFILIGKGTWILFTARIPLFFMGCYAGYMLKNNKEILYPNILMAISVCAFVVELFFASRYDYESMHRMGLYYIPQMFIVPGGCLLLALLLDKVPTKVLIPFRTLGTMTLEIYLVHMSMRCIYPESKYLLPILIAIALHYFVNYATKYATRFLR